MTESEVLEFRKSLIAEDTRGLQKIYSLYKNDCISFLHNKGYSNHEDGEGVFTDAILALHNNIVSGKVTEIKSLKNYLIGICINISHKKFHKVTRFRDKIDEIRDFFKECADDSIEDSDYANQMQEITRKAVSNLPEQCRKIITCFYLYQMSMKEIASELQLASSDVAKTLKSRCFKKLMKQVNALMPLQK